MTGSTRRHGVPLTPTTDALDAVCTDHVAHRNPTPGSVAVLPPGQRRVTEGVTHVLTPPARTEDALHAGPGHALLDLAELDAGHGPDWSLGDARSRGQEQGCDQGQGDARGHAATVTRYGPHRPEDTPQSVTIWGRWSETREVPYPDALARQREQINRIAHARGAR